MAYTLSEVREARDYLDRIGYERLTARQKEILEWWSDKIKDDEERSMDEASGDFWRSENG